MNYTIFTYSCVKEKCIAIVITSDIPASLIFINTIIFLSITLDMYANNID